LINEKFIACEITKSNIVMVRPTNYIKYLLMKIIKDFTFPVSRRVLLIFMIVQSLIIIAGCTSRTQEDGEPAYVFKDITVIDAVNGLRTGQSVVVRGDRIVQAGPVEEVDEPSGATIIDCRGKYLIPGLWDAHVHLLDGGEDLPPEWMFPLFIVNGITYVRDTSGYLDLLLALREKASRLKGMAPRVFITGPHIDGLQYSWDHSFRLVTAEQAALAVDSLIRSGVDQIKVYELPSPEVFLGALSMANSKGYRVSAHVPLTMDVIEASEAGLGSMEHMRNLELSCSRDWDSLLKARQQIIAGWTETGNELRNEIYRAQRLHAIQTQDKERREAVLKTLAENDTWQVPTLTLTAEAEHRMYTTEKRRESFRYLPEPTRSEWKEHVIRRAGQSPAEERLALAHWAYDMIPRLVEAGIGIMAGTDMPLAQLTPGFSLHEELVLLERAGMTPMQVLEAATLRPAQFLGLEKQQGSVGKGMMADLVILDANPLEDIANTQRINSVMRDGRLHTREDLDDILDQLENPR
jgi:hypothetical protein